MHIVFMSHDIQSGCSWLFFCSTVYSSLRSRWRVQFLLKGKQQRSDNFSRWELMLNLPVNGSELLPVSHLYHNTEDMMSQRLLESWTRVFPAVARFQELQVRFQITSECCFLVRLGRINSVSISTLSKVSGVTTTFKYGSESPKLPLCVCTEQNFRVP